MPADYYERQQRRLERAEERAAKARREASSRHAAAREIGSAIPMGQPILGGHHSEKRHRRDIARMDGHMGKAIDAGERAEYHDRKAAAIQRTLDGKGPISSDAPDAAARLAEKLASLERLQATMKQANEIIRAKPKNQPTMGKLADLCALGIKSESAAKLFQPDSCGRIGFAGFQLSNNNAEIRRVKARLASLQAIESQETREWVFATASEGDITVRANTEANRLQMIFGGKPADATRAALKRNGFRWARGEGAWQRQLTGNARAAAREILCFTLGVDAAEAKAALR